MTALSIPERAREIAAKIVLHICEPRGGDSPYGWSDDAHSVLVWGKSVFMTRDEKDAKKLAKSLTDSATRDIEMAMHSERELCAKELEDMAASNLPSSVTKYGVLRDAAKLLREGGQK